MSEIVHLTTHEHQLSDEPVMVLKSPPPHVTEVRLQVDDDAAHVQVTGELDVSTTPLLEQAFTLCHASRHHRVQVDADGLNLVSAAGITALLREAEYDRRRGGYLWVQGARRPIVERLLRDFDVPLHQHPR